MRGTVDAPPSRPRTVGGMGWDEMCWEGRGRDGPPTLTKLTARSYPGGTISEWTTVTCRLGMILFFCNSVCRVEKVATADTSLVKVRQRPFSDFRSNHGVLQFYLNNS